MSSVLHLTPLTTFSESLDIVWSVAWNSNGKLFATSGSDCLIRIYVEEGSTFVHSATLDQSHSKSVRSVTFSPCGRYLASCSFDATTIVWEKKNNDFEVVTTLEGHENEVKCVAWSPSGQYLATCGRDKTVWVWEIDEDEEFQCCSVISRHSQDVKMVTWHPKEDILASCSYDDSIKFYAFDGDDWVLADDLPHAHESTVWAIAFNGAGDRLASVGDDRVLKIWQHFLPDGESGWLAKWFQTKKSPERAQWKCVCTISGFHSQPIYTVHWCPLSDLIATGCGDNAIRIFRESDSNRNNNILNEDFVKNQPEFEHVQTIENAHEQDVNCVRWNPKMSKLLLSCSDDGSVKLWRCSDTILGQDLDR